MASHLIIVLLCSQEAGKSFPGDRYFSASGNLSYTTAALLVDIVGPYLCST